ncbi:hypothetical protein GCM10027059_43270 [Myceligenerans halotolerans]
MAEEATGGVEVPHVVGLSRQDAIWNLDSFGFRARVKTEPSEEVGLVVGQAPWSGEPAPDDMVVTIWIGTEPPPDWSDEPVPEEDHDPPQILPPPDIGKPHPDHWKRTFPGHPDPFA